MKKATNDPLVSIIVPIFNAEKYFETCIKSIIDQSYKNIEILLVDDGSTDNSPSLCDDWSKKDKRIKVFHRKNNGVSSTRNYGLSNAKGDYVAFIDSDDWVNKTYIESLVAGISRHESDICICGLNRVAGNDKTAITDKNSLIDSRAFLLGILHIRTSFGVCYSKIYKSSVAKKARFDESVSVGEDALYNIRVSLKAQNVSIIEDALYNYRINPDGVVRRFDHYYSQKYLRSMSVANDELAPVMSDAEVSKSFSDYLAFHAMLVAVNFCCHPNNHSKRNSLRQLCHMGLFWSGIKNSKYSTFSLSKKIVLFCLKHKLYTACICLGTYRQRQNRK